MQLDRRDIERSLKRKGFVQADDSHHIYFHHEYNGRRTGIYTYTSRGSGIKVYSGALLSSMKRQLELDSNQQLLDLVNCPMSGEAYNELLKSKGRLHEPPQTGSKQGRKR